MMNVNKANLRLEEDGWRYGPDFREALVMVAPPQKYPMVKKAIHGKKAHHTKKAT